MIFNDAIYELASRLSGRDAPRVFLALPAKLDFRAWKRLPQAELAAHCGISQSAVSRALRELERCGVVERRGNKKTFEWRLCRAYGDRGRSSLFHADEREAQILQLHPENEPDQPTDRSSNG